MKSAIGIGALLMDGLGDTIRVSLTEVGVGWLCVCTLVLVMFVCSLVRCAAHGRPGRHHLRVPDRGGCRGRT